MNGDRPWRPWPRPSLGVQILALLLGGLVVAQMVTVFLTLVFPPDPQPQYGLSDIAAALSGEGGGGNYARPLRRVVQSARPAVDAPGWFVSESSQSELATLLNKQPGDVLLYYFTPPPFAGTGALPVRDSALETPFRFGDAEAGENDGKSKKHIVFAGFVLLAQAGPPPGAVYPGGPGGPDAGFIRSPSFGSGLINGHGPGAQFGVGFPRDRGAIVDKTQSAPATNPSPSSQNKPFQSQMPTAASESPALEPQNFGSTAGARVPPIPPAAAINAVPTRAAGESGVNVRGATSPSGVSNPQPRPILNTAKPVVQTKPVSNTDRSTARNPVLVPQQNPVPQIAPITQTAPPSFTPPPAETTPIAKTEVLAPIKDVEALGPAIAPEHFNLGSAPFIQGDFIAALKLDDGRWSIVSPAPEGFPNSWQRRVLLWFAISFAVVAPLGWLLARRVVRPIAGFADAAEQLGRDPRAPVLALGGPSEVGRAAHAFNRMQNRLRSFVDDRTAMVGAISHDLRTPLTRMRFRLEDAPDDIREGMELEVAEMEAMINSVLTFIRDASEPGIRERLDLRTIVEDVVEDAVFVGGDVTLEQSEAASVEVDVLGMRRLLSNLVENAVKYGDHAKVRLFKDQNDAVTEISDGGPGLPDEELERVFQPFYRGANARQSDKQGSGLGLAVCRSIARAHGGDVRLMRSTRGLVAQLRVPLTKLAR